MSNRSREYITPTIPGSNDMTLKPERRSGELSDNDASTGAKTSSAQDPVAFSSVSVHSCHSTT